MIKTKMDKRFSIIYMMKKIDKMKENATIQREVAGSKIYLTILGAFFFNTHRSQIYHQVMQCINYRSQDHSQSKEYLFIYFTNDYFKKVNQ